MRGKLEKGSGSQGGMGGMQRAFLPSLLKSKKRMEIQEISGETQKLVPTHSLFILPQYLLAPLSRASHPRREEDFTIILGYHRVSCTWWGRGTKKSKCQLCRSTGQGQHSQQ